MKCRVGICELHGLLLPGVKKEALWCKWKEDTRGCVPPPQFDQLVCDWMPEL